MGLNKGQMAHKNIALVLGGGGAAGNAWMTGIIAGLAEGGLDLTEAADLPFAMAHLRSLDMNSSLNPR